MGDKLKRLSDAQFPELLRDIPQKPAQLYVRGELPSSDMRHLAVVGSRALTPYGRQAIEHLISGLRGYPIVIVSGLAYGADACAHAAAIDAGLPTIAVPGSGLDYSVLYPRANVRLARDIIDVGGAHLSEFEPDQKAADYTFPRRNRIMAGMSHATLVVEAQERSGSLITARLATEYNRELLVVPGSIFSAQSKGTHQFLKLGATPVTDPDDILRALGLDAAPPQETRDLSEAERSVLRLIATGCPRDVLIEELGMPAHEASTLLSMMEIKGLIVEEFGLIRQR